MFPEQLQLQQLSQLSLRDVQVNTVYTKLLDVNVNRRPVYQSKNSSGDTLFLFWLENVTLSRFGWVISNEISQTIALDSTNVLASISTTAEGKAPNAISNQEWKYLSQATMTFDIKSDALMSVIIPGCYEYHEAPPLLCKLCAPQYQEEAADDGTCLPFQLCASPLAVQSNIVAGKACMNGTHIQVYFDIYLTPVLCKMLFKILFLPLISRLSSLDRFKFRGS